MQGCLRSLKKEVEVRQSSKHSVNMHNTIRKLANIPENHYSYKSQVEEKILHLYYVHNVKLNETLKRLLLNANPSKKLLNELFISEAEVA